MKALKVLGYIIMMLVIVLAFFNAMVAGAINFGYATQVWGHVPNQLPIKTFAWNTLLVMNVVCTYAVGSYCFFRMFVPTFLKREDR